LERQRRASRRTDAAASVAHKRLRDIRQRFALARNMLQTEFPWPSAPVFAESKDRAEWMAKNSQQIASFAI